MLPKEQFYKKVKEVKKATSKTGRASYSDFKLERNILMFKRSNTGVEWKLNVDELFNAYSKEKYFNTIVLKKYMSARVFFPSLAVLLKIKVCDLKGNRI